MDGDGGTVFGTIILFTTFFLTLLVMALLTMLGTYYHGNGGNKAPLFLKFLVCSVICLILTYLVVFTWWKLSN